ncbi:hypothetical protein MTR_4g093100 [Medicago truncatula]|uniref:Uncharacterized protein n=1 Tax=Medicago truncatula TaxID=3880 RepID=G7JU29_MEDTR|nr:hypothetical protein MTR_4g093100 [Medicago truncatula]
MVGRGEPKLENWKKVFEAPLPNLSSSMPGPTYLEGPLNSFAAILLSKKNTNSSVFTTTTSEDVSPSMSLLYSR